MFDELRRIEEAARTLRAGPASVSREYRRRLAATILTACARIRCADGQQNQDDEGLTHFYVGQTLSTACGIRVYDYPHFFQGKRYWKGRPECIDTRSMSLARKFLTCDACLERLDRSPELFRQPIVSHPLSEILAPEYRDRIDEFLTDPQFTRSGND